MGDFAHQHNHLSVLFIVYQVLVQSAELLHLKVLEALHLRLGHDGLHGLGDLLLDANWNVLVDKVLHLFQVILIRIDVSSDAVKFALNLLPLIMVGGLILLLLLERVDLDSQLLDEVAALFSAGLKYSITVFNLSQPLIVDFVVLFYIGISLKKLFVQAIEVSVRLSQIPLHVLNDMLYPAFCLFHLLFRQLKLLLPAVDLFHIAPNIQLNLSD